MISSCPPPQYGQCCMSMSTTRLSNLAQLMRPGRAWTAMFAAVDNELGRLNGLVNNAGVVDLPVRVDQMSLQRLRRMFAISLKGSFLCAREAVKRMSTRHGQRR
jgi:NAD(P)-dependent dehydrogenase (short-subunit alcohol dehydrogenase family)